MKNTSYEELLDQSVPARAFMFYWLTCGSFAAQITTLAPISVGDTVHYRDGEDGDRAEYIVRKIIHQTDAMSTDHRILMTFLECEAA
jgi:hypothetical protein